MIEARELFFLGGSTVAAAHKEYSEFEIGWSGANLLIGCKHSIKDFAPGIALDGSPAGFVSGRLQIGLAHCANRRGQRFRRVLLGPMRLVGENNAVHIASVDSDYGGASRLALKGDEAECFLNAWMNKQVGRTVNPGELLLVRAVA
jgi:hypothetical protein